MIALDTNVIIRMLVQDDPKQSKAVNTLVEALSNVEPGYICREVMVEVVWVLERAYGLSRAEIVPAIEGLLSSHELIVEEADRVGTALGRYSEGGAGFADQMILAASRAADCNVLATFDKQLGKLTGAALLS